MMVNSQGEKLFNDDDGHFPITMEDVRARLFRLIQATPNLDWLILTKRPERMAEFVRLSTDSLMGVCAGGHFPTDFPNVWLGTTVENQAAADERIPILLRTQAAVRFLSCEPLIGPVDFNALSDGPWNLNALSGLRENPFGDIVTRETGPRIDWVIVGGESGHGARPMHPDWARSIRDQCLAAGVAFFFKQWGEHLPGNQTESVQQRSLIIGRSAVYTGSILESENRAQTFRIGKKAAGRLLDGREWSEFPVEALR